MPIEIKVLNNRECRLSLSEVDRNDSLDKLISALEFCDVLSVVLEEITSLGWSGLCFFSKLRAVAQEKGIKVKLIR